MGKYSKKNISRKKIENFLEGDLNQYLDLVSRVP